MIRRLAPALAALLTTAAPAAVPLDASVRAAWARSFAAIHAGDWAEAQTAIDAAPDGPLKPVARAELWTAKGAPVPDAATITQLLTQAPDLPEAPALAGLARQQGATTLPTLPIAQELLRAPGASKRQGARANRADAAYGALAAQLQPLLKSGDIAAAEPLVEAAAPLLAPEALTEWRQRLAWAAFGRGDDSTARRLAASARAGAGAWAVEAAWVEGLAAWRQADYAAASSAFAEVGARGADSETQAAGLYWAARSDTAGGRPQAVAARLRQAASRRETFYGMLAAAALDAPVPATPPMVSDPAERPNLLAAAQAAEIGETALADQLIRQQARIGRAGEHGALIAFAGALHLPQTQLWLCQNVPAGAQGSLAARYPMPAWMPSGGWRVDRALLYAHALQESRFRVDAVSPAGARGLMQLMPGTARLVARHKGDPAGTEQRLTDPALNFEYGQSYLEELAAHAGTGGLLPKVIAAYNAGPNNVALWNLASQVQNDPLLFIEAIPFSETRGYVAIVLRNYWMYSREAGAANPSLDLLAQERWPRFPIATRLPVTAIAQAKPSASSTATTLAASTLTGDTGS
jgi:soluble lytic murein transglycosylase-like protein